MKTAFENRFVKIMTEIEKSYCETVFFPLSVEMSEEEYKSFYTVFLNVQFDKGKYRFSRFLVDMRDFGFTISPEMQLWIAQEVN
jgi:hypothetical protein